VLTGQAEHKTSPVLLMYPRGHEKHAVEPLLGAYVPAAQSVQVPAPTALHFPRGHTVHVEALVLEKVPASQLEQDTEPGDAVKLPGAQTLHAALETAPRAWEKVPAGQEVHGALLSLPVSVPVGHFVHSAEPADENVPCGHSRHLREPLSR
jgi:hypothetical protein